MTSVLSGTYDYSTKSHLFEAVWIAASSPICLDHIVQKVFLSLFLKKNSEGEPLYLYDTAVDLAEDELEEDIESSVVNGFQEFFSIGI